MEEDKVPVFGTWKKAYFVVVGIELCVIFLLYLLTIAYR